MATGFTYEPGSTFKAFTVAGALEKGLVTPSTMFELPPSIQVADRVIEEAHEGVGYGSPQRRRHPQVLLQRRRGEDRARARRRGLRPLDPPLRLRQADRRPVPRRGAGDRDPGRGLLRLDDGQPADRPGALGDPDADGGRIRRDRQRRHPAHPAARPLRGRRADSGRRGQARDQPQGLRRPPRDARGRLRRRAAPPRRSTSPATPSPARPGRRRRSTRKPGPTRRPSSLPRSSASPPPRTRSCWSRSWSTHPKGGNYYGGTVAAPAFGEIAKFALPYLRIPAAVVATPGDS